MKTILSVATTLLFVTSFVAAEEFVDDFAGAEKAGRQAERGEWQFQNGIASCVADPDLYKQFKNHGPILKWTREFNDTSIEFELKATNCQRVVFTLNGDGHIFRVTLADETPEAPAGTSKVPTRIIAWASTSSKENQGETINPEGMADLPAINGEWVRMKLDVKGKRGMLTIGAFQTELKHAALGRDKNMVMLTFAHGEIAVRNFRMTSSVNSVAKPSPAVDASSRRVKPGETGAPYGYFVRKKLQPPDGSKVPLIISLHGAGGGKNGVDGLLVNDETFFASSDYSYLFVRPATSNGWEPDELDAFIDVVLEYYKAIVDPKRIYLFGYSMVATDHGVTALITAIALPR